MNPFEDDRLEVPGSEEKSWYDTYIKPWGSAYPRERKPLSEGSILEQFLYGGLPQALSAMRPGGVSPMMRNISIARDLEAKMPMNRYQFGENLKEWPVDPGVLPPGRRLAADLDESIYHASLPGSTIKHPGWKYQKAKVANENRGVGKGLGLSQWERHQDAVHAQRQGLTLQEWERRLGLGIKRGNSPFEVIEGGK
jgi:hypothetical protein